VEWTFKYVINLYSFEQGERRI